MDLESIREGYAGKAEQEWQRLEASAVTRTEYLITSHCLRHYLPGSGRILDAGSGSGRYSIDLAGQKYDVVVFDLVAEMLRLARGKAGEAKVARHLLGFVEGDITWLPFHDRAFDAVISLGAPLSHLTEAQARSQALAEMARVVKPEGWIFITGLMRLAFYRSAAYWADWEFFDRLVSPASQKSGLVRGSHEWYGFASGELEALVQEAGLRIVDRIGCEGLAAQLPLEHLAQIEADPNRWPVWKEALLRTCNDPTIIGVSNHLLVVARKI